MLILIMMNVQKQHYTKNKLQRLYINDTVHVILAAFIVTMAWFFLKYIYSYLIIC
jgi:hypothetical protein